jgi:hypothetical protein
MIKRLLLATALLVTIISGGYYFLVPHEAGVGTALPDAPALFETSLAAPITSTATSFSLTNNSVRGGGVLSGYQCFTIDEGSAQAEFVCGTASGTAVTNVTRGISPSDGITEVTALKFAHRRGASVKITDFPVIQIIRNQNNGEATFENVLRYAASVVPSSASDLADVGYVLSVVNGGTVNFDALVVAGTAGETLATGTLVYFKTSDQRWWKVNSSDTTTFQDRAVGITRGNGTAGTAINSGGILLKGLQSTSTLVAGATYFASSSAGTFSTATSVLPIGYAKSTTELYFDPVMISVPRLGMNNTFTGTNTFSGLTVGFGTASQTAYTSAGTSTYTKSALVKYVQIEMCGGGGTGGTGTSGGNGGQGGAGGGAGGYAKRIFLASALNTTSTLFVGGTSTFAGLATTTGGTNASAATPGVGGTATGGTVNIAGQSGNVPNDLFDTQEGTGVAGGSSLFGFGGIGGISPGSGGLAGGTATGYCAGGGGGGGSDATSGGSGVGSGGAGTTGIVIVTEYF